MEVQHLKLAVVERWPDYTVQFELAVDQVCDNMARLDRFRVYIMVLHQSHRQVDCVYCCFQVPIQPHSKSGAQEVPNGFSYGASRGIVSSAGEGGIQQQFQPLRQHSASPVPNKTASIDQLLNEIEREYYGPGYRYGIMLDMVAVLPYRSHLV